MRKILFFIFSLFSIIVSAQQQQNLGGINTVITAKNQFLIDSAYRGPLDTLSSAPIYSTAVKNGTFYIKNSSGIWVSIAGGGSQSLDQVLGIGNTSSKQMRMIGDTLFATYAIKAGYGQFGDSVIAITDTLIWMGDSWIVGSTGDGSPVVGGYASISTSFYGRNVWNLGVNGTTLSSHNADGTSRIENLSQIPTWNSHYKIAIIGDYGLNDAHYVLSVSQYQADYITVIDAWIAKGWSANQLVIASPGWNSGTYAPNLSAYITAGKAAAAARTGVQYVDIYAGMITRGLTTTIGADALHPTAAGYAGVAQIITHGITGINFGGNTLVNGNLTVQKQLVITKKSTFNDRVLFNTLIENQGGNAVINSGVGMSNIRTEIGRLNNHTYTYPFNMVYNVSDSNRTFPDSIQFAVWSEGGHPELTVVRNGVESMHFLQNGDISFNGAAHAGANYAFNGTTGVWFAGQLSVAKDIVVAGNAVASDQRLGIYRNSNSVDAFGVDGSGYLHIGYHDRAILGKISTGDGSTFTPVLTTHSNGDVGIGFGSTDPGQPLGVNGTVLIGNGTTTVNPFVIINTPVNGASAYIHQTAGTRDFSLVMADDGTYGGTANNLTGGQLGFHYLPIGYLGGFGTSGTFFHGPTNLTYSLSIAKPNAGVTGLAVDATGLIKYLQNRGSNYDNRTLTDKGYVDSLHLVIKYAHTIFTPTTGGTVTLVNGQYNIINPAGTIATLTINLPSSPANNDVVYIKFTQNVTTVTYGNGTVVDGITAPTAGGMTVLTYDAGTTSWY